MTMADRIASMGRMAKTIVERLRPGSAPIAWPDVRIETIGGMFLNRLNWRWGGKAVERD